MICEARFSNDARIGDWSFISAAPSDASGIGSDAVDVPELGLPPLLYVISFPFGSDGRGRASWETRLQNSANGVTSGMLDLLIAGGKAEILLVAADFDGESLVDKPASSRL